MDIGLDEIDLIIVYYNFYTMALGFDLVALYIFFFYV